MLFVRTSDGEGVRVVGRSRLTDKEARRMLIREMIIMRSKGFTDAEIGLKYRYHSCTVNKMINSAPDHVKERLREIRLV